MNKVYITEKEQEVFKKYLKLKEYKKICKETGYKMQTVYEIITRRKMVNPKNIVVYKAIVIETYNKMKEDRLFTSEKIKEYNKLKIIKDYKKNEKHIQ